MTDSKISAQTTHSIGAVERDTGLGKDTLRVWERRYQFPQPQRDANGEREYPEVQLKKLRLLKRLIDCGHRPAKIIHLEMDELRKLSDSLGKEATTGAAVESSDLKDCLELCKEHQVDALRQTLSRFLLCKGLQSFVVDVIGPLNQMVGNCWACGLLTVGDEHLYTEVVQGLLRNAIHSILQSQVQGPVRPSVLLATFPQEPHGLGLLMAEAMFALEGARCISLGVQTPIADIIRVAEEQQADIVALSFSASSNLNQTIDGLADLISKLSPATEVWAGGSGLPPSRRTHQSVQVLTLTEVPAALMAWHQRNQRSASV